MFTCQRADSVTRCVMPHRGSQGCDESPVWKVLKEVGLWLGDQSESCDQISASPIDGKLKRDQIRCQSPAPGSLVAPNTPVLYVIGEDEKDD